MLSLAWLSWDRGTTLRAVEIIFWGETPQLHAKGYWISEIVTFLL